MAASSKFSLLTIRWHWIIQMRFDYFLLKQIEDKIKSNFFHKFSSRFFAKSIVFFLFRELIYVIYSHLYCYDIFPNISFS